MSDHKQDNKDNKLSKSRNHSSSEKRSEKKGEKKSEKKSFCQELVDTVTEKYARLYEKSLNNDLSTDEHAEYGKVLSLYEQTAQYRQLQVQLSQTKEILNDPNIDKELLTLAQSELNQLYTQIHDEEKQLIDTQLHSDEENRDILLEIRAGSGGEEAGLFAAELLRMYHRFCESKRWKVDYIQGKHDAIGSCTQAILSISGGMVYQTLRYESGVHRVQRIPITESSGRIHTSAATVAILAQPSAIEVHIDNNDLRIDTYRASGAGGQHVNKTDSAVRITHLPTNIVVQCQDEKSQHRNRQQALQVLRARLYDFLQQQQQNEIASTRRSMIGSGDRSQRIRTYNFPQGRVTDHRINLTLYKLQEVLDGPALNEIISALQQNEKQRLLTSQ